MKFGMDMNSVRYQIDAGVKPDYASFWIGPWTLKHGWGGADKKLETAYNNGITPMIHFYYWGDDISPNCVENGCWSDLHDAWKDKAGWEQLTKELVEHLHKKMKGKAALIIVESEFNKNGISEYEPFDGYMQEKMRYIRAGYSNVELVLGFGNWNSGNWYRFDRAAAEADMIGVQGLRSSVRNTLDQYYALVDKIIEASKKLRGLFGRDIFIDDTALSTYPEPAYLKHQAAELQEFFDRMDELKAVGIKGWMYRTWKDSASMSTNNYHKEAERHWGFAWNANLTWKPSAHVWIKGVKAERAGSSPEPPPPPDPSPAPPMTVALDPAGSRIEAEGFALKTAGGSQSDSSASGGKAWNLWSNGRIEQRLDFPQAGPWIVRVAARGSELGGVGPQMTVALDGKEVLSVEVPSGAYGEHRAIVSVGSAGPRNLTVAFTNDAKSSTEDRNLRVDYAELALDKAPVAKLSVEADGLAVRADGSGSSDPDGDELTHRWEFGDGATAEGPQASHAYASAGTYTVKLTVSDGHLSSSASKEVQVVRPNQAPRAAFVVQKDGLRVSVDGAGSSDPDGDALTHRWEFGDGATAEGARASHTYAAPGTYWVRLVVSDGDLSAASARDVVVERPPLSADFRLSKNVNNWWIEVYVDASEPLRLVEASVDGGAWKALSLRSWGAWAGSAKVQPGAQVVFRATAESGQQVLSQAFAWPGEPAPPPPPAFEATFTPKGTTNNWWVEVKVTANEPLAKVEARVDGGAWKALSLRAWGAWAASFQVKDGQKVQFRATSEDGDAVLSSTYTWG